MYLSQMVLIGVNKPMEPWWEDWALLLGSDP
jgi:hypothetical protein